MKEIEFTTKGRIKINETGMNTMYVDVPYFPTGQYKDIQFSPTIVSYPPQWEAELIEKAEIAKPIEVRYKELESRFNALEGNVFPAGEVEALQERVRVAELQRDEARAALQEAQKAPDPVAWYIGVFDGYTIKSYKNAKQIADLYGLEPRPLYDRIPVVVPMEWISVEDGLPEDGESVGFIIDSPRDEWNHGRAIGGRFNKKQFDNDHGGFSVPGITWAASHWCRLPPVPDVLHSSAQAEESNASPL